MGVTRKRRVHEEDRPEIGARLRAVREAPGLSRRELGRRAGVTNGTVSLIEQDKNSPSVASLKKILDVFPMTFVEFFALHDEETHEFFYPRDNFTVLTDGALLFRVIAGEMKNKKIQILHERYEPGGGYYCDSNIPHRFRNTGDGIAIVVSACTPPSL